MIMRIALNIESHFSYRQETIRLEILLEEILQ